MVNYNTLHKDIHLTETTCGKWDITFQKGDLQIDTDKKALRDGLIIACLTSWNYLNHRKNPTYETFGNKSYWELNKKKSSMVQYTIKQYFIEVLNNIRRVHKIEDIQVIDNPTDPNAYDVIFTVQCINDEIVTGRFSLATSNEKSTSTIQITQTDTTATPTNPVKITITLLTEYGVGLPDELLYIYTDDGTFLGVCGPTDENGQAVWTQYPFDEITYTSLTILYNGNSLFNPSDNTDTLILSKPFYFLIDNKDNLHLIKNKGLELTSWIGEVIDNTDNITYDKEQPLKCYLLMNDDNSYIKYYYDDGEWHTSNATYTIMPLKRWNSITKTVEDEPNNVSVGQIRLFVENSKNELYLCTDKDKVYGEIK